MKVLLSIKPEFVNKIFAGTKKFEFRRSIFKNEAVKKVIVYASAPVSRVVGEFEIEDIIKDKLPSLWSKTKEHSGINESFYYDYFNNREEGFAIKIGNVNKYTETIDIMKEYGKRPPQSFIYVH